MTTTFREPSNKPDVPDCQPYAEITGPLVALILRGSSAVADFAGFLDPESAHGPPTLASIRRKIGAIPNNADADALFGALADLHQNCPASEWQKRLGEVVECVFEGLMASKYPACTVAREKCMDVTLPQGEATTATFPIDVIAWDTGQSCGEALEVKKAVRSIVNDKKVVKKIRQLETFAQALAAAGLPPSFIGLANLFDDAEDTALYLETMLGRPVQLGLLTRDTLAGWQGQRFL